MDNQNVNQLIAALDRTDVFAVRDARAALAQMGTAVTETLEAVIETGTLRQVANTVTVLGMIAAPASLDLLIWLLQSHSNIVVRGNAVQALSKYSNDQALNALIDALRRETGFVAMSVISSLEKMHTPDIADRLLHYLEDKQSAEIHYLIIRIIGNQGNPSMAARIKAFLKDDDNHIRQETAIALQKLGCEIKEMINQ